MKQINLQATDVLNDLTHFRYAKSRVFSNHPSYFLLLSLLYFAAHKYITEQWHEIEFMLFSLKLNKSILLKYGKIRCISSHFGNAMWMHH